MASLSRHVAPLAWPTKILLAAACAAFLGTAEPQCATAESPVAGAQQHPLAEPLELIKARQEQIQQQIQDFTCVLVKRERVGGELQEQQRMVVKSRLGAKPNAEAYQVVAQGGNAEAQPEAGAGQDNSKTAIYLEYLAPHRLAGRRVLYVEGRNNGRMLVRKGGPRFGGITMHVSPDSDIARRESNNPVTEICFDRIAATLVTRIEQAMQADPTGENTEVEYFDDAKINGRPCLCIRVLHSDKADGLKAHLTHVFIDQEHQLPVRLEVYGWPESEEDDPPLLNEVTYTELKLNVGLGESDFDPVVVTGAEEGAENLGARVSRLFEGGM